MMKKFRVLYKTALFSYLIDPLFYVTSILTILFCSFRFFFAGKFFVAGFGSTNLRPFFNAIPYISTIAIPLLVLRVRPLLLDDSIPISPFNRFLSLNCAVCTAVFLPVILLVSVPLCVSFFGTVDIGQCFSGFFGIFFFLFLSISLTSLLFAVFFHSFILPIIISVVVLACVNFLHLVPLYFKTNSFFTFLCQEFSFAWHFDSFGKGILDSRNCAYYVLFSFLLILLSVLFEYKRLGKKSSKFTSLLFALIFIFLSLSSKNLYFRLDLSHAKQFSVSQTSKLVLSELEHPLRITYFRSKELKDLYPQTEDVAQFLSSYAQSEKNVTLAFKKAEPEKLKNFGIQDQQIRREVGSKTEFVTVYSAILLQYLEESAVIPFTLSTNTLEYDLTQRVQQFVTQKTRKVYLLCGNGRDISESYLYVAPWLTSRGFEVEELTDFTAVPVLQGLSADDEIALFGTKNLTDEESFLLQNAVERGTKLFVATSPFHTTIEDEWKISKNQNDSFISYLNGKGFAFGNALVEDISCYPLTMESGEGSTAEYATVNYPLWVVLQSQKEAKQGATVFFASPLFPYGDVEPLLYTTNLAWLQNPAKDSSLNDDLFLTNPFLIPKTAQASDSEVAQFIVAGRSKNISLVSDQFFLSSLMTGFISGESSGDFRNYDYFVKELFMLRGEEALASLMQKSAPITALHKLVSEEEFSAQKTKTIVVHFVALPIVILLIFVGVQLKRRYSVPFKNATASA